MTNRSPTSRSGGKAARQKGDRNERRIVNALVEAGISARRVPLSGASATHKGDIEFFPEHCLDEDDWDEATWRAFAQDTFIAEVKARKALPGWILDWLGENDCLFLIEDRQEPLVVLRLSKFMEALG